MIAAGALLDDPDFMPRHACWLAQQAAEKTLKVVLVFLQIDFPHRHDLDALRNLIPEGWQLKFEHPDLADLTEWAVEARYPGDWPESVEVDVRRTVTQAGPIWESVLRDLNAHGFDVNPF